ncbi:hypothetical protein ANTQUA_LOCUS9002 [Anthophora quadrimaculata]
MATTTPNLNAAVSPAMQPKADVGTKKKRKRTGRRGGRKVQAKRRFAIARELAELKEQTLPYATPFLDTEPPPRPKTPEIITIESDDESDTETVYIPVPPPAIEILDTDTALKVYNHRDVPDEVLVSFVRNFIHDIPDTIPDVISEWCNATYLNQ